MPQTVWCRYPGCGSYVIIIGGCFPDRCASCQRSPAKWTTIPPDLSGVPPRIEYLLTYNDVALFLKRIGVQSD